MDQESANKTKSKGRRCHKCSIAWISTSAKLDYSSVNFTCVRIHTHTRHIYTRGCNGCYNLYRNSCVAIGNFLYYGIKNSDKLSERQRCTRITRNHVWNQHNSHLPLVCVVMTDTQCSAISGNTNNDYNLRYSSCRCRLEAYVRAHTYTYTHCRNLCKIPESGSEAWFTYKFAI